MTRAATTYPRARPTMRIKPFTGGLELAMAEATADHPPRAEAVSRLLTAALADIDDTVVDAILIRSLSVGTRDWLLARLAARLRPGRRWFDARCQACGAPYDFGVDLTDLPLTDPGPGFPVAEVATSLGPRRFEAPNGGHEETLAGLEPGADAGRRLVALCGLGDDADADAARFTDDDLAAIDDALDALSPQFAERVESTCPECRAVTVARLDPLTFAFPDVAGILRQTHLLARAYHWAEADILALPSPRRRAYLDMVAADRMTASAAGGRWG